MQNGRIFHLRQIAHLGSKIFVLGNFEMNSNWLQKLNILNKKISLKNLKKKSKKIPSSSVVGSVRLSVSGKNKQSADPSRDKTPKTSDGSGRKKCD